MTHARPGRIPRHLVLSLSLCVSTLTGQGCVSGGRVADTDTPRDTRRAAQLTQRASEVTLSDPARALELLTEAIGTDPFYASAQNNLGVLHLQQGQLNSARIHLENARRLAPNDPSPRINLAMIYADAGMPRQAEELYEETLAQFPTNRPALRGMLVLRAARSADDTETISLLEQLAVSDDPGWSEWARSQLRRVRDPTPP